MILFAIQSDFFILLMLREFLYLLKRQTLCCRHFNIAQIIDCWVESKERLHTMVNLLDTLYIPQLNRIFKIHVYPYSSGLLAYKMYFSHLAHAVTTNWWHWFYLSLIIKSIAGNSSNTIGVLYFVKERFLIKYDEMQCSTSISK